MTRLFSYRVFLLIALVSAPVAWGHGIELFAAVEGAEIRGLLQYHDGPPVANAPVHAYAPDGSVIAETSTGDDGRFTLPITKRCDYRIVGDAGDGHAGSYTVEESELPAASEDTETGEVVMPAGLSTADLDARIEAAVARQIAPLREQLFNYEKATRFRDILGGAGYLFGLAGLVVLVKGRKASSS